MENLVPDSTSRIFNTPLEIGLRVLVILNAERKNTMDVERLMYFDYLSLNTGDLGGATSLHAPVPNRGVQVYARKELIQKGLAILLSKELINVYTTLSGFMYSVSDNGKKFLEYFDSEYYKLLVSRATWVISNYSEMSNERLREFINQKLQDWGGEFITEHKPL
jgi:hypothetical protein